MKFAKVLPAMAALVFYLRVQAMHKNGKQSGTNGHPYCNG